MSLSPLSQHGAEGDNEVDRLVASCLEGHRPAVCKKEEQSRTSDGHHDQPRVLQSLGKSIVASKSEVKPRSRVSRLGSGWAWPYLQHSSGKGQGCGSKHKCSLKAMGQRPPAGPP